MRVKAVFDDIRATRKSDFINNLWLYLAFDPALLEETWQGVKSVMAVPSALDPLTKELIYIAVSITNSCRYCVHSHTAAARAKGMTEGTVLFNDDGQPSEYLTAVRDQLEKIEAEVQRTRLFGEALVQADLLTEMRFDATLPDGKTLTVDGFLAVDEKKFATLSDAKVLELHKNGALGLIHAHQISLRHMRRLVEWRQQREAASAAPAA